MAGLGARGALTMVATLWIRRPALCDMLVYFGSRRDAYDFAADFLDFHGDATERVYDWDCVTMGEDDCHHLPRSVDLQLSIHDGQFFHAGWLDRAGWAPNGTALLSADEALEMGNTDQPADFVLGAVDAYPWMRDASATTASYYMRSPY